MNYALIFTQECIKRNWIEKNAKHLIWAARFFHASINMKFISEIYSNSLKRMQQFSEKSTVTQSVSKYNIVYWKSFNFYFYISVGNSVTHIKYCVEYHTIRIKLWKNHQDRVIKNTFFSHKNKIKYVSYIFVNGKKVGPVWFSLIYFFRPELCAFKLSCSIWKFKIFHFDANFV